MKKIIFILIILIIFAIFLNRYFIKSDYVCDNCNIVLISLTNLRPDHTGIYGYYRNTTPNIDVLAKDSLIFENAFTHASWTLPSGISLFTSQYPFKHKMFTRSFETKLNDQTRTLIDILKQNGYTTAGFTGGFEYDLKYNLVNRFDYIKINLKSNFNLFGYASLKSTVELALDWLNKNHQFKFFLFVQGYDVHCPFYPPTPYNALYDVAYNDSFDFTKCVNTFNNTEPKVIDGKKYYEVYTSGVVNTTTQKEVYFYNSTTINEDDIKHMLALYDSDINYVDNAIGLLLKRIDELGLSNKTIIIILSEHGDMFGKHGRFMRGGAARGTFYDDVLRIPLIIKNPKFESQRIEGLVQIVDIMPTILYFLDIRTSENFQGKSLTPLITKNKEVNEYVYAGSVYDAPANPLFNKTSQTESIRSTKWKLIRETIFLKDGKISEKTNYELYDTKKDPEELNNVINTNLRVKGILENKLNEWIEQIST